MIKVNEDGSFTFDITFKVKEEPMTPKVYKCIKCHKECDPHDMKRITVSSYDTGKFKQWYADEHYDMCNECYTRLLAPWWRRPLRKTSTMKGGGSNE